MDTFPSGIILLFCIAIVRGDQCIEKQTEDWEDLKEYRLSCGQDNRLIEVNVIAGSGTCKKQCKKETMILSMWSQGPELNRKASECEGSTPYMIENQYNCYWRQQCSIRVPKIDSIDIIVRGSDPCLAKRPDYFSLSTPLCIDVSKPAQIIDAVADFKAADECIGDPSKNAGVIRSHHYYPWDYEGLVVFGNVGTSQSKCFEIYRLTAGDQMLIVTVRDLDLWSTDHLKLISIGDGGREERTLLLNNTSVGETLSFSRFTSAVRVIFHVNAYSNGGRGFLLCFAHVDFQENNPDACAEISISAKVEPVRGESIDSFMLTDPPRTTVETACAEGNEYCDILKQCVQPSKCVETCKDCKKRCRKVPKKDKKERKACRKSCKPLCKKPKGDKKRKGKKKDKSKGKKRQKRMKETN